MGKGINRINKTENNYTHTNNKEQNKLQKFDFHNLHKASGLKVKTDFSRDDIYDDCF